MPWTVAGRTVVYERTSNWRPYFGCVVQRPVSRRLSPICAPRSGPTTVSRSGPVRSVATRAIVYPVSSLAYVIRSSTASSSRSPVEASVCPSFTSDMVPEPPRTGDIGCWEPADDAWNRA